MTHSRLSPDKRARIRAFFAQGVEKHLLPAAVEILPTLLHISLFLFFAGLVVFLSNVNLTIFKLVLSWVGVCVALYGCVTLMPIFCHDSPYHTSLSSSVWPIVTGFACFASIVGAYLLYYVVRWRRGGLWLAEFTGRCYTLFSQGMQKTVEEAALKTSSEIVNRAFMWTFDSLDEDHELERFFLGLPGFRSSKVITDPLPDLTSDQKQILSNTLTGLMDRTFSSDLLPVPVKERRAMVCMRAIDPVHFPDAIFQLFLISSRYRYSGPLATGIVQIVKDREVGRDDDTVSGAQAISSTIVARLQPRDDSWFSLASNELGFPEVVLRGFATHGDSLSLAVLLHVARQQFVHFRKSFWPSYQFRFVLAAASKFEVQDTLPELQNEFCALWNQIVCKVQNDNNKLMASRTLDRFATCTLPYTNIPIVPQHNSLLPLVMAMTFSGSHPPIRCATSLAITQTHQLTYTTIIPPRPLCAPPCMTMTTPHLSLPSFPVVQIQRLHQLIPHFVLMKALQMSRCSTRAYLLRLRQP